jgi:hypothetical protein
MKGLQYLTGTKLWRARMEVIDRLVENAFNMTKQGPVENNWINHHGKAPMVALIRGLAEI